MNKIQFLFLMVLGISIYSQKVQFKILPTGHMLVPAKIEGVEGQFIFDTGAGINVFFEDFVSKFSKKPSSYNFMTGFRSTGERIDSPLFMGNDLIFGEKKFKNMPFATVDLKIPGVDGLISLKNFENQDIMIDYVNQEISFQDKDPKSYSKPIDIFFSTLADDTLSIFTYITLNNKLKIKVLLDSGAGSNSFWFNDKMISLLGLDRKKMQSKEMVSEINKSVKTKFYVGNINQFSNQFITIKPEKVIFVENLIYEGKTSLNWIGKKIVISIKNRKIYKMD